MSASETGIRSAKFNPLIWIGCAAAVGLGWFALSALNEPEPPLKAPRSSELPSTRQIAAGSGSRESSAVRGRPGPWGQLEFFRVTIEPPDEFIQSGELLVRPTRWFLGTTSEVQVAEALKAAGFLPEQSRQLLQGKIEEAGAQGVYLNPDSTLVLSLPALVREKFYGLLAEWQENYLHLNPYSFHVDDLHQRFERSGLSEETIRHVQQLLYRRGSSYCFSDLPEVLMRLESSAEKRRLIKTLSRHPTVLMKLLITPETDVAALVRYWGKGGRAKDIEPLLESLTRVPEGASIDVAHLMPPFSRQLLYTFPYPSRDPVVSKRNCFWTALNYFNEKADDRFCDAKFTEAALQDDYYPIQNEPAHGDIVLLLDARDAVVHAAVFLADDMVFTKNGRHFTEPWRIMRVEDMLAEYPFSQPLRPVVYRSKKL